MIRRPPRSPLFPYTTLSGSALDGPAAPARVDPSLVVAEGLAGGDADLRAHEVDAVHLLGHRVLDLEAGVDLVEVELRRLGVADVVEELGGAGIPVADLLGQLAHGGADADAVLVVEGGAGRLLDELLVAALHAALALAEVDDVAVLVGEELELDVARLLDELLDEDLAAALAWRCVAAKAAASSASEWTTCM